MLKQKHRAAELKLVAVVQLLDPHGFPVDQRSVRAVPIAHDEQAVAEMDRSVLPGDFRIADPNVVPAAASQRDQFRPDLEAGALVGPANDQERRFRQIRFLVGSHAPYDTTAAACFTVGVNGREREYSGEKRRSAQDGQTCGFKHGQRPHYSRTMPPG